MAIVGGASHTSPALRGREGSFAVERESLYFGGRGLGGCGEAGTWEPGGKPVMRVERAFGRCVAEMRSSAVAAGAAPAPPPGGRILIAEVWGIFGEIHN